jgi:hypothetical protein
MEFFSDVLKMSCNREVWWHELKIDGYPPGKPFVETDKVGCGDFMPRDVAFQHGPLKQFCPS